MTDKRPNATEQNCELSTVQEQNQVNLSLDGELNISDYVGDAPLAKKTAQEMDEWARKQREQTRTCLASRLSTLFGCTLLSTLIWVGAASFSEKADKTFIKDVIPLVITPQVTLLGVALTFYFTSKEK
jgi:hypothetical protein